MPVNNEILSSSIARQMLAQGERYENVMAMFRRATLSAALEFTLGHQRLDFQAAIDAIADPSARDTYRAEWHNRHRTSMNDIGASAQRLATLLREREPAEVQS